MLSALNSLGIDYRLLIAQLVNFILLFVVLYIFLYKPVLKILNERSNKVNKSLDDAEKIEKRLVTVELEIDAKLATANQQTNLLLAEAQSQAKIIETNLAQEAQIKADQMIAKAKKEITAQQQKMIAEAQTEIATLVSAAIKLIAEDKTIKFDNNIIDSAISKIKQGAIDV